MKRRPALRMEQMGLLRDAVGCTARAPEYRVLAKAVALLMMYASAERMRGKDVIGFSPGNPADGEPDPDEEDDDE